MFRRVLIIGLACVATTWLAAAVPAASLSDYQSRVSEALVLLQESHAAHEEEGLRSSDEIVAASLTRVRELLPAKETVLFAGKSVPVDNSWLHESLAEYEKTRGVQRRSEILEQTSERLLALSERLKQIGAGTTPTDPEANKGRLAEILRRPEYQQKAPEETALQRLVNGFLNSLSKLLERIFPKFPRLNAGSSSLISGIAQILIVGICVAAIAFLIWRYGPRLMQRGRKKKTKPEARIVLGERLEPDQTAADLLAQAEDLARAGDLRAAIRKAYIALLCELGDRKLISLGQSKTNRDYLNSVRDKATLYGSMRRMTSLFELHWYGFVPAGETDWVEFRNIYRETLRTGSAPSL